MRTTISLLVVLSAVVLIGEPVAAEQCVTSGPDCRERDDHGCCVAIPGDGKSGKRPSKRVCPEGSEWSQAEGRCTTSAPQGASTSVEKGSVSAEEIRKSVSGSIDRLMACYEKALQTDSTIGGRLTVSFTLGREGKVIRTRIRDNSISPKVGECIADVIRTIRFPQPKGGEVTFSYPFYFEPASESSNEAPFEIRHFDQVPTDWSPENLQQCRDRACRRGKCTKRLRVTFRIEVRPDGYVRRAKVLSPRFKNKRLRRCLESSIRRWRYVPSRKNQTRELSILLPDGKLTSVPSRRDP